MSGTFCFGFALCCWLAAAGVDLAATEEHRFRHPDQTASVPLRAADVQLWARVAVGALMALSLIVPAYLLLIGN